MAGNCLPSERRCARSGDHLENREENGAPGVAEFVTPFTPLRCDFGENSKTRWFSMVRMDAMDAEVLYLQMTSKFPSWTSRVRSPSPALYFQRASAILTPFQ